MEHMDSPLSARAIVGRADDGMWHGDKAYNGAPATKPAPTAIVNKAASVEPAGGEAAAPKADGASAVPDTGAQVPAATPISTAVVAGATNTPAQAEGGEAGEGGTNAPTSTYGGGGVAGSDTYKLYTGDGTGWPKMSEWVGSFETM